MNKRALKNRSYSSWRIDVDYWDKLTEAEVGYLVDFLDDFYHRSVHDAAQRDLVTITDAQAESLLKPSRKRGYTPEDYKEPPYAVSPSARQGSRHRDD